MVPRKDTIRTITVCTHAVALAGADDTVQVMGVMEKGDARVAWKQTQTSLTCLGIIGPYRARQGNMTCRGRGIIWLVPEGDAHGSAGDLCRQM